MGATMARRRIQAKMKAAKEIKSENEQKEIPEKVTPKKDKAKK